MRRAIYNGRENLGFKGEFFTERHLVKFSMRLRGRELANKDYGINKLKGVVEALQDVADVEQEVKRQGDQFIVILRPKR
jgi:translation initiation factor IF-3